MAMTKARAQQMVDDSVGAATLLDAMIDGRVGDPRVQDRLSSTYDGRLGHELDALRTVREMVHKHYYQVLKEHGHLLDPPYMRAEIWMK